MPELLTNKGKTAYNVRIVCGLLFILFSILFLSVKAPVMEAMQHVLSEGKTSYSATWGTCIITLTLCLIQLIVSLLSRLVTWCHGISYFPSMLLLALITHADRSIYSHPHIANWIWPLSIGIALYLLFVWINHRFLPLLNAETDKKDPFQNLASNALWMLLLSLMVVVLSPLNPTFLAEAKIDSLIRSEQYEKATAVGEHTDLQSRELTTLWAYSLSQTQSLPKHLFEHAHALPSSEALLPDTHYPSLALPAETLYAHLGGPPHSGENCATYLWRLCHTPEGSHAALDYYLCALLLDKKLERFVEQLQMLYDIDEALPKHYKEALVLYQHQHAEFTLPFDDAEIEQKFQHYIHQQDKTKGTYWWYYWKEDRKQ